MGRVWRKVSEREKERWCLEVSHEDFNGFLVVKQRIILINKEGDEEGSFETTSQVEEGLSSRILNKDHDRERALRLEGNTKNLS